MFALLMGLKTMSPTDLQARLGEVTVADVNARPSWLKAHVPAPCTWAWVPISTPAYPSRAAPEPVPGASACMRTKRESSSAGSAQASTHRKKWR